MNRRSFIVPILLVLSSMAMSADPLKPENFQYSRTLQGPLKPGKVYKVALPGEVLDHTAIDQRDVRIFSPKDSLIPFTILKEHRPAIPRTQYKLNIRDFSTAKGSTTMVLAVPEDAEAIRMLYFSTPNRNFKKSISISSSNDKNTWTPLVNESLFDFSRNVDLRKTSVSFEPVQCRWFKVVLKDVDFPPENEAVQLKYKDLEFSTTGKSAVPFRINSVTASTRAKNTKTNTTDTMELKNFTTTTDSRDNTVISFSTGIPISSISIVTTTPAFYRTVSLKGEQVILDRHDVSLASGTFYKFSLGPRTEQQLKLSARPSDTGNYKLTIFNGDNTPLTITALQLNWVRRNLFLVPELGTLQSATLCYGNPKVAKPHFDVARFIRQDNWEQHNATTIEPESSVKNTAFQQAEKPWTPEFSRIALRLLVLMIVAVLGIWLYRLLSRRQG
ncbi:MAG: DUF3999 family protein [Acidobacteria bacterium]|nr:DUF3999 family protein [Acidobacteriota bacterium]